MGVTARLSATARDCGHASVLHHRGPSDQKARRDILEEACDMCCAIRALLDGGEKSRAKLVGSRGKSDVEFIHFALLPQHFGAPTSSLRYQ